MFIERVKEEDLDKLADLYMTAYKGLEEYAYTHPKDVKSYMRWLWNRDREGMFVAKEGGKIVGFIAGDANWFSKRAQRNVGAIHELVVHPDHRRKGVGRSLMKKVLEYFKEKGLDTAELWVGDENRPAMKFYEGFGFEEDGRYNYWVRMILSLKGSKG